MAFEQRFHAIPASRVVRERTPGTHTKVVVVHGGARDAYQLALGLEEAGLLEVLVTDLFWSTESDRKGIIRLLPNKIRRLLRQRSAPGLSSARVSTVRIAALGGLIDRFPRLSFPIRRWIARASDAALGRAAGRSAKKTNSGLVSYSYFAYDAFKAYGRGGLLFQAHPHPATMRRILRQELMDHPDCAGTLQKEWELALPEEDFEHLVSEPAMASHYLVASTFTRDSLIENGAPREAISVVPYGVDLECFRPNPNKSIVPPAKLRLLFVGRINQRKGIKYLVQALRLLPEDSVRLTVCGRVIDGLGIFNNLPQELEIVPDISAEGLVRAYQTADLFVFPSVAEGFGQVLLEALACGVPILSTTHTAAPDLIDEGVEGFIVAPRRSDLIADRISWALVNRTQLAVMGARARQKAEQFTWATFRSRSADVVQEFLKADRNLAELEVA